MKSKNPMKKVKTWFSLGKLTCVLKIVDVLLRIWKIKLYCLFVGREGRPFLSNSDVWQSGSFVEPSNFSILQKQALMFVLQQKQTVVNK